MALGRSTPDLRPGDRVRLISCADRFTALVKGDKGTVAGSLRQTFDFGIRVDWDCGSKLSLIPAEDEWEII